MSVLVLYEEGPTRAAILGALEREGIEARTAENVFRAIADFTSAPCTTVLVGVGTLGERDLSAIAVFREIEPDVHIFLGFSPSQRELAAKGLEQGADGYLLEPFYMEEMVAIVRRAAERHEARPDPEALQSDAAEWDAGLDRVATLAADVAHEINNPLQIVRLTLDGGRLRKTAIVPPFERIEQVARLLSALGRLRDEVPGPIDVGALLDAATGDSIEDSRREIATVPDVLGWPEALSLAFAGIARRAAVFGTNVGCGCREAVVTGRSFVEIVIASEPHENVSDVLSDEVERPLLLSFSREVAERLGGHLEVEESPETGARYEWLLPVDSTETDRG